jgi:hypothetical protein
MEHLDGSSLLWGFSKHRGTPLVRDILLHGHGFRNFKIAVDDVRQVNPGEVVSLSSVLVFFPDLLLLLSIGLFRIGHLCVVQHVASGISPGTSANLPVGESHFFLDFALRSTRPLRN